MGWAYMSLLGIISAALLLGAILRSNVKLFRKYLIPAPILGGFLLLFFTNFAAPSMELDTSFLGEFVYHLLNLSFIAMMLRGSTENSVKKTKKGVRENIIAMIAQYGLQPLFGLILTGILIMTISPNLFPAFGFLLPLGFELGPGQAYSIAETWEGMGFVGGPSLGLTIAACGFLVGSIGGIILINGFIKKGYIKPPKDSELSFKERISKINGECFTLDALTYHIALVLFTYLLSYIFLTLLSIPLGLLGPLGEEFAESLFGVNFIISAMIAVAVKQVMKKTKVYDTVDTVILTRISGLTVDFTVVSSLGAISLAALTGYWIELILIVLVGIIISCVILPKYCMRLFSDHQVQRTLVIFGTATGTLPTGLALLRVVDPEFETPAATDYMFASAAMFFIVIPFIIEINLPAYSYTKNNPWLFAAAIGLSLAYTLIFLVLYFNNLRLKKKIKS